MTGAADPLIPPNVVPQFLALVEELSVGEPVPCRRESPEIWWGKETATGKVCTGTAGRR